MRIKSTGLGKTELICEVESVRRVGDHLLMSIQTTTPVKWHVRIALTHSDLRCLLMKGGGAMAAYMLSGAIPKKELAPLENY